MLRLTLISLLIALLLLAPALARQMDAVFPGMNLLAIPATGLDYMAVFFHELGHTAASWIFGRPAIPTFDWQDGGGMTYNFGRSMLLQGGIWLVMLMAMAWLWKHGEWGVLATAAVFSAAQCAVSFSETGREMVWVYMGHGGEILVACFCIFRAATNSVEGHKAIERWLNMVFGLFALGRNALLCRALFDDVGQAVYDMQKGGHMQGDFRTLADLAATKIENVAAFSLVFMAVMLALTIVAALRLRPL